MKYRKFPFLSFIALAATAFTFVGCDYGDVEITNLTPEALPENPSNVYTIQATFRAKTAQVVSGSIQPSIVIDGETYPMEQSDLRPDLYEFEYRLPSGRQDASFYLLADYQVDSRGFVKDREAFTDIESFRLINRYAYSLEVTRAPVGASVGVVGRGFSRDDVVKLGGLETPTTFNSSNSLTFHVPSVEAGHSYEVTLADGSGEMNLGVLRVDPGRIDVTPDSLSIREGDRAMVVFSTTTEAPPGGLYLDVTTDIPESVIMPEVVIPEGSRSVSVPVEGAAVDEGELWVEMDGYETVQIPITIE